MPIATRVPVVLGLAALVVALVMAIAYFPLRADDAYIVGRYAKNVLAGHGLVFNAGEPVNALTSPLHLALLLPLQAAFGDGVTAWRVLSAFGGAAAVVVVALRRWGLTMRTALYLALVLASPFVAFWFVGGLETPLLAALCATIATLALGAARDEPHAVRRACLIVLLATLAVFTRYDAVLFVGPIALAAAARHPGSMPVRLTLLACAIAFGAWLAVTYAWYGNVLPTSFYVKAGRVPGVGELALGALYLASFGVLSWWWLAAAMPRVPVAQPVDRSPGAVGAPLRRPVLVGLALTLAYALFASTRHMMYLYRLLVPFLPVLALLALDRVAIARTRSAVAWTASVLTLQALLGVFIFLQSENPTLSLLVEGRSEAHERFEFSHVGARHTADFLAAVERQAPAIAAHWARHGTPGRAPRVMVSTGGLLPYLLPEAYTLEKLVSYRPHCEIALEPLADYVQVIYRGADVAAVAAERSRRDRELLAQEVLRIDGLLPRPDELYVELWYRRSTAANRLPPRIGDACPA